MVVYETIGIILGHSTELVDVIVATLDQGLPQGGSIFLP